MATHREMLSTGPQGVERADQVLTGTQRVEEPGAVISAAGEELQLSGRKMAFVGGPAQR
jgi:hypothetical protein